MRRMFLFVFACAYVYACAVRAHICACVCVYARMRMRIHVSWSRLLTFLPSLTYLPLAYLYPTPTLPTVDEIGHVFELKLITLYVCARACVCVCVRVWVGVCACTD